MNFHILRYAKLQRWDDALKAYTAKASHSTNPHLLLDATLGLPCEDSLLLLHFLSFAFEKKFVNGLECEIQHNPIYLFYFIFFWGLGGMRRMVKFLFSFSIGSSLSCIDHLLGLDD